MDYEGHKLNSLEYAEDVRPYPLVFLTNLPLSHRNARETAFFGRRCWKIENEGFNAQKNHGFSLGHMFSRNCRAMKNHYYLIQIGHMIAQIMDAWKSLWEGIRRSKKLYSKAETGYPPSEKGAKILEYRQKSAQRNGAKPLWIQPLRNKNTDGFWNHGEPKGFRTATRKRLPAFKSGSNKRLYGKGAIALR